jgi:hypothetical protein
VPPLWQCDASHVVAANPGPFVLVAIDMLARAMGGGNSAYTIGTQTIQWRIGDDNRAHESGEVVTANNAERQDSTHRMSQQPGDPGTPRDALSDLMIVLRTSNLTFMTVLQLSKRICMLLGVSRVAGERIGVHVSLDLRRSRVQQMLESAVRCRETLGVISICLWLAVSSHFSAQQDRELVEGAGTRPKALNSVR